MRHQDSSMAPTSEAGCDEDGGSRINLLMAFRFSEDLREMKIINFIYFIILYN
jgi:hypothetical protein